MTNITILYRDDFDWQQEEKVAKKYFNCTNSRVLIKPNNIVIPRFSALPFYKEQEKDINLIGSKLINTYQQHRYVADIKNWSYDLEGLTPKTWLRLEDIPEEGPFILKGETNSKKYYWKTHMFAKNKREAIEVHGRLLQDSLISYQDIVIRQYVPLYTYMEGLQNLPITKEFRFFILYGKVLCGGYYWSSHVEDIEEVPDPSEVPEEFINKVISKTKDNINFYTVDIAQTASGEWVVIELNDGSMSGLSENDPEELYSNMKRIFNEVDFKLPSDKVDEEFYQRSEYLRAMTPDELKADEEFYQRASEYLRSLTPDELFAISVEAGIHNEDGTLTENYANPQALDPKKSLDI